MKLTPELRSRLASEYVLGTLRGGARRRFESLLRTDRDLKNSVATWQAHLTPLAERLPAVTPPTRVWDRIEERITQRPIAAPKVDESLLARLTFWRRFSFGASSLAAALLVTMFTGNVLRSKADVTPMVAAVLEEEGQPRMMVDQHRPGILMVRMIKPWQPMPGVVKQLWLVMKDGSTYSLGLLDDYADTKIINAALDAKMEDGSMFAISKEPPGGSPTGQPTGMVFCKGMIAKVPKKASTGPKAVAPI
jgi:anti-sigma-K factor RskA